MRAGACWELYWLVQRARNKRARSEKDRRSMSVADCACFRFAILALMLVLLMTDWLRIGPLAWRFVPDQPGSDLVWRGLTGVGVGLAIWARWNLGRNWSDKVVLKVDHELIRERAVPLFAASDLYGGFAGRRRNRACGRRMARRGGADFDWHQLLYEGDSERKRFWRRSLARLLPSTNGGRVSFCPGCDEDWFLRLRGLVPWLCDSVVKSGKLEHHRCGADLCPALASRIVPSSTPRNL